MGSIVVLNSNGVEWSVGIDVGGRDFLEARMTGLYAWETSVIHIDNL